jgi:hypothetical protein
MRTSLVILAALCFVPAALASGPWLGTSPSGFGYTAVFRAGTTVVGDESGSVSLAGKWGFPRVTTGGTVGGLSADGHTLVLGQPYSGDGRLQTTSSFTVLATKPLRVVRTITLRGDFGFDALAPHAQTLYLIQHVSQQDVSKYRVRAYDLASGKLLARVMADKSQRSWLMSGYPVARTASADGRWVYTFYANSENYPFVHALDTTSRTAVCIGVPWSWTAASNAIANATLHLEGKRLLIGGRFALDTGTFAVTKL